MGAVQGIVAKMNEMGLASMRLRYEDQSLFNKILDEYAHQQSKTRQDVLREIRGALEIKKDAADPIGRYAIGQVQRFITNPVSIEVRADPVQPVSLSALVGADIDNVAQSLGLVVLVNQGDLGEIARAP